MDRKFYIRAAGYKGCFCSACGKKQLQDIYNYRRHGAGCGFDEKDNLEPVNEEKGYGYRLSAGDSELILEICRPYLMLRPGFYDRYMGGGWKAVFSAVFPVGERKIEIRYNETGEDPEVWFRRIREEDMVRIAREEDKEVIRRVFPVVPDIYSLEMFIYIYQTKGYVFDPVITHEQAERLLAIPLPVKELTDWDRAKGSLVRKDIGVPVKVVLYRVKATGARVLRVKFPRLGGRPDGTGQVQMSNGTIVGDVPELLISRNYFYADGPCDLNKLFDLRLLPDEASMDALHRFSAVYPEYHLDEYMEPMERERYHPGNFLVPLLTANYHHLMELAAKAGVWQLMILPRRVGAFQKAPGTCRNLKEAFGLPVPYLRKLSGSRVFFDDDLLLLSKVWRRNPAFLDFDGWNDSMITFMREAALADGGRQGRIGGADRWTDRQILKILRYLYEDPWEYTQFRDYLNLCDEYGEYVYGLIPKNVMAAHLDMIGLVNQSRESRDRRRFVERVTQEKYRRLATNLTEEDQKTFEEDPFLILLPMGAKDLAEEGKHMHNCVWGYTQGVLNGRTRIVFLRKKECPEQSFGTIEVLPDDRIIQAKAFANGMLGKEAQAFLRKWAEVKGLTIETMDLNATA